MTEWDFRADIAALMRAALDGKGPQTMSEMVAVAEQTVAYSTAQESRALDEWLHANATTLVGQQLLVYSVHSQTDVQDRFAAALREWAAANPAGQQEVPSDPAPAVVEWMKERHPGLLRAWLLGKIEDLVRQALESTGD